MKVFVVVIFWNTSLDYHLVDEYKIDSVYKNKEDAEKRVNEIERGINLEGDPESPFSSLDLLHTYEYVTNEQEKGGNTAEDIFFACRIEEFDLK